MIIMFLKYIVLLITIFLGYQAFYWVFWRHCSYMINVFNILCISLLDFLVKSNRRAVKRWVVVPLMICFYLFFLKRKFIDIYMFLPKRSILFVSMRKRCIPIVKIDVRGNSKCISIWSISYAAISQLLSISVSAC